MDVEVKKIRFFEKLVVFDLKQTEMGLYDATSDMWLRKIHLDFPSELEKNCQLEGKICD